MKIYLILLFLIGSCSFNKITNNSNDLNYSHTNRKTSSEESNFLKILEEKLSIGLTQIQADELNIIKNNLLKFLLEASYKSNEEKIEIFNEMNLYLNKIYPVYLNNLTNPNSRIPITEAPHWTLKEELKYIKMQTQNLSEAKNPIQLVDWFQFISKNFEKINPNSNISENQNLTSLLSKMENLFRFFNKSYSLNFSLLEIENLLTIPKNSNHNELALKLVNFFENKITPSMESIKNLGQKITESGQVDLKIKEMRIIVTLLDYYFSNISEDTIKTMLSEMLSFKGLLTEEKLALIIFQNTGPGIGKLLQQLGKEKGVGNKLQLITSLLESDGKAVPIHLALEIVNNDSGGFKITEVVSTPLGTGTVGQVNKAILIDENDIQQKVALRFLKPGIETRCEEDINILRNFITDKGQELKKEGIKNLKFLDKLINGVRDFLNEEVQIPLSIKRQKMAYDIYAKTIKIKNSNTINSLEFVVPKVFEPKNGKTTNLHIQEFVGGGVKYSNLESNELKKIVSNEMMSLWFEEALFKSGYLHADLHQGNFRVALFSHEKKIKIYLYDFGLSTILSKDDQHAFILLGAGAEFKDPELIAKGLMISIRSNDPIIKKRMINKIKVEMKKFPNNNINDWILWSVQKNYPVSEKLASFGRGASLLKQLPELIQQEENFDKVIFNITTKNLLHSMADRDYAFPIRPNETATVGLAAIKSNCKKLIRAFYR